LSAMNRDFIQAICSYLGITTKISDSSEYNLVEGRNERLIDLCEQLGANHYFSGPSAQDYIDQKLFSSHGIEITWLDYSGYPEYSQLWDDYISEVSVLDLLFNEGSGAKGYMKYLRA